MVMPEDMFFCMFQPLVSMTHVLRSVRNQACTAMSVHVDQIMTSARNIYSCVA